MTVLWIRVAKFIVAAVKQCNKAFIIQTGFFNRFGKLFSWSQIKLEKFEINFSLAE
jgi:hypothetical protein